MAKRGFKCHFYVSGVNLVRHGIDVACGSLTDNELYTHDTGKKLNASGTAFASNMQLWHERFGQVQNAGINEIALKNIVPVLHISENKLTNTLVRDASRANASSTCAEVNSV